MYKLKSSLFIITAIIGCLIGIQNVSAAANKVVVHQIKLEVGKSATITLPNYYAKGISWKFIKQPNKKIAVLVKAYAVAPTSTVASGSKVGGVGTYNYIFKGVRAGVANVEIRAIRSGNRKAPIFDSYLAKITVAAPAKPINCGKNESCANKLVANCAKGSYVYDGAGKGQLYTVKGKNSSGTCDIEWGYIEAKYPLTGLKMTCSVPGTVKTTRQFDSYILGRLDNCTGTLKAVITKPASQIPPEPAAAKNVCTNADCANRILSTCTNGTFSISRIKNNSTTTLDFIIISPQVYPGICQTKVSISHSPQTSLIGPTMQCMLKSKVKSMFDLQNFVTDKFFPADANSHSSCEGNLYQLVKDVSL